MTKLSHGHHNHNKQVNNLVLLVNKNGYRIASELSLFKPLCSLFNSCYSPFRLLPKNDDRGCSKQRSKW